MAAVNRTVQAQAAVRHPHVQVTPTALFALLLAVRLLWTPTHLADPVHVLEAARLLRFVAGPEARVRRSEEGETTGVGEGGHDHLLVETSRLPEVKAFVETFSQREITAAIEAQPRGVARWKPWKTVSATGEEREARFASKRKIRSLPTLTRAESTSTWFLAPSS
ncbi:hypothetical protein B0A49_11276 [Cryomyces minteri]|uniref:Uncharacterized protein n=1 Tax=Cryomyces minteri TaxID=331657 RepID=A0A4U0VNB0_9PEZI|nr:hypothetical protein B0A49_11276 [Cryomyces minteri]